MRRQIARLPGSAARHDLLGHVHLARGETARAETAYLKALEVGPQRVNTYVRVGDLHAASGRYEQALARLDQALEVNPRNQVALMLSGVVHQRRGDVPGPTAAYGKVLALNPLYPHVLPLVGVRSRLLLPTRLKGEGPVETPAARERPPSPSRNGYA